MYDQEANAATMPQQVIGGAGSLLRTKAQYDPTVRENLDNRIAELKKAVEELERIKSVTPPALIDMKISDLREAMRF